MTPCVFAIASDERSEAKSSVFDVHKIPKLSTQKFALKLFFKLHLSLVFVSKDVYFFIFVGMIAALKNGMLQ